MDSKVSGNPKDSSRQGDEDISIPWNLSNEYRFAPARPQGDPWRVLLDPLLEKDRIQCDAWKDEVANLLIFAGLFSAVVTAFIIESYKTLRPDPNDDIVALLSQIANTKPNVDTNTLGVPFTLPSESFSPTHSEVRVNVFWFLSLVFSLCSVLIGTMTLTWLQHHQAYPGRSPQEMLAIYHMRSEGMQTWHVWKILMVLPLLLQLALVLFFAGVIDFLHALGNDTVLIPVTVAIGIILLFFIGTTTLPALQTYSLILQALLPSWKCKKPPSQCPYKSPQSIIACSVFDFLLQLCSYFWFPLPEMKSASLRQYLTDLCAAKAWIDFDLAWLKVRDAYSRTAFDINLDQGSGIINANPTLFDTLTVFRTFTQDESKETLTSESISAAYHCLSDLSTAITTSKLSQYESKDLRTHVDDIRMWNRYFEFSFNAQFDPLVLNTDLSESASAANIIRFLHERNISVFLDCSSGCIDPADAILTHRQEVRVRIQQYLLGSKSALPANVNYPTYLQFEHSPSLWRKFSERESVFIHQYMNILHTFFDYISRAGANITQTDLQARPEIMPFLRESSRSIHRIVHELGRSQTHGYVQASEALTHLLDDITTYLRRMNTVKPEDVLHFLYCASVFASGQTPPNGQVSPLAEAYKRLLFVLQSYRKDAGLHVDGPDAETEKAFRSKYPFDDDVSRELWPLVAYRGTEQNTIPFSASRGPGALQMRRFESPRRAMGT